MVLLLRRFAASPAVVEGVAASLAASWLLKPEASLRIAETGEKVSTDMLATVIGRFVGKVPAVGGPYPRRTGIVSIELPVESGLVLLDFDEYIVRPSGGDWHWGNSVSVSIANSRRRSTGMNEQIQQLFVSLAARLDAVYGYVYVDDEWAARHRDTSKEMIRPVGLDLVTDPPPVYWMIYVPDAQEASELAAGVANVIVTQHGRGAVVTTRRDPIDWPAGHPAAEVIRRRLSAGSQPGRFLERLGVPIPSDRPTRLDDPDVGVAKA